MLEIKNLKKSFNRRVLFSLDHISFEKGKIYSLVGGNGTGKSTLLRIIYGLETFDSGSIALDNIMLDEKSIYEKIAFSPQTPRFLKGTLDYNMRQPFKLKNISFPEAEYGTLLKIFDLEKLQNSSIETLSGGEKSKVQFIRTLLYDKEYILLDEPTASTDATTTSLIEEYIFKEAKERNKCIILISHDTLQTKKISDIIISLESLEKKRNEI